MSRRLDKAWEDFLREHTFGGGEEYYVDWESAARSLQVSVEAFRAYGDDYWLDLDGLRQAVETAFYNPRGEHRPPIAIITTKCQRCDRRLDIVRLRAEGWAAPKPGSQEGWKLEGISITSRKWAREVGDSFSELIRKFAGESVTFDCACGRRGIQFSYGRIVERLGELVPEAPRWSRGGDDASIVWPETRQMTIRG